MSRNAAQGGPTTTELEDLRDVQIPAITKQIYQQNNGQEFNIKSPKQVAEVLFGVKDRSTNKEALEGMAAGGNRMADLILQYRRLAATVKRLEKRADMTAKGTFVSSVSTVVRPAQNTTTDETVLQPTDPLLILDATAYIFRAYHSMPPIRKYTCIEIWVLFVRTDLTCPLTSRHMGQIALMVCLQGPSWGFATCSIVW